MLFPNCCRKILKRTVLKPNASHCFMITVLWSVFLATFFSFLLKTNIFHCFQSITRPRVALSFCCIRPQGQFSVFCPDLTSSENSFSNSQKSLFGRQSSFAPYCNPDRTYSFIRLLTKVSLEKRIRNQSRMTKILENLPLRNLTVRLQSSLFFIYSLFIKFLKTRL